MYEQLKVVQFLNYSETMIQREIDVVPRKKLRLFFPSWEQSP